MTTDRQFSLGFPRPPRGQMVASLFNADCHYLLTVAHQRIQIYCLFLQRLRLFQLFSFLLPEFLSSQGRFSDEVKDENMLGIKPLRGDELML